MKLYNPILTPDSLWPAWADTGMSENVDIQTLPPDSLWPVRAGTSGLFTKGIRETLHTGVSEIDHGRESQLDKVKPRLTATRQSMVASMKMMTTVVMRGGEARRRCKEVDAGTCL